MMKKTVLSVLLLLLSTTGSIAQEQIDKVIAKMAKKFQDMRRKGK